MHCLLLDVHYLNDQTAVGSGIGLTPPSLLEFSAAVGTQELSIGGEIGFTVLLHLSLNTMQGLA